MGYYLWTISGGKLGTARLARNKLCDFSPADIEPSVRGEKPNLIDSLLAEIDESPLAEAMTIAAGGKYLSRLTLEATSKRPRLFVPGLPITLTLVPKIEYRMETHPAEALFTEKRLGKLNEAINAQPFRTSLLPDVKGFWQFPHLRIDDLPQEIDYVVAVKRSYEYLGEVIEVDEEPVIVGFGGRTVGEVEAQLCLGGSDVNDPLQRRLKSYRTQRRERYKLRPALRNLTTCIDAVVMRKAQRSAILEWIYEGCLEYRVPSFLKPSLDAIRELHKANEVAPLFERLYRDILARIRERTAASLSDAG